MAILMLALVTLLPAGFASPAAAQSGPPGDREIRVTREGSAVITTLTLMLSSPTGPMAINLVLTGRHDPSRPIAPPAYEMAFQLPVYTGPRSSAPPHYRISVANGPDLQVLLEGNVDPRLTIQEVSTIQAPLDAARLSRLAGAGAAGGQVFGAVFTLTREQIAAIGDFANRAKG